MPNLCVLLDYCFDLSRSCLKCVCPFLSFCLSLSFFTFSLFLSLSLPAFSSFSFLSQFAALPEANQISRVIENLTRRFFVVFSSVVVAVFFFLGCRFSELPTSCHKRAIDNVATAAAARNMKFQQLRDT